MGMMRRTFRSWRRPWWVWRAIADRRDRLGGGGEAAPTGAETLLGAETNGIALDFTDMSAVIVDTTTPANDFNGDPNDKLTYSSPSAKWVRDSAGLLVSASTLQIAHDPTTLEPLGLLCEAAKTNLALHNRDFTNAVWTKTNMTTAKTATGPDGVVNSASTLTATAANATALQAITSASASRVSSMFIKRRTGTGVVNITQDNGATWTVVTVTSSWTRVSCPAATIANPTVGVRIVTSGDAVDVDLFQQETGTLVTSPITTAAASVTRARDVINLATTLFPYSAAAGTLVLEASRLETTGASKIALALYASSTDLISLALRSSTAVLSVISSVLVASLSTTALAASTFYRFAAAFAADDYAISKDGAAVVTDVAGAMPAAATSLQIGYYAANTLNHDGHIKQVMYLPRRATNVELVALAA